MIMEKFWATAALVSTIFMIVGSILVINLFGFNVTSELEPLPIPLYLEPAGYAFIIWLFIYIGFLGLGIYQFGNSRISDSRFITARPFIIVNSLANVTWFLGVFTDQYWLTIVCMLLMLYTLIRLAIALELGKTGATLQEKLLVKLPIALYFGWITAATPINLTSFLIADLGWTGEAFLGPEIWSAIVLVVAAGIYSWLYLSQQVNAIYIWVGVWAFVAIYVVNNPVSNIVAIAAGILGLLLLIVSIIPQIRNSETYAIL